MQQDRCDDEKASYVECVGINIDIKPRLIQYKCRPVGMRIKLDHAVQH